VTAIGDLLSDRDRQHLEQLADPNPDLAEAARAAAAESDGTGRIAWLCCAVALTSSDSPDDARAELGRMLEDGKLKTTALACLAALTTMEATP
jgi:hypothetical protein